MWQYITDKSIFWHKQTLLFAVLFVMFRLLSIALLPYPYIMSAIIIVLMFLFGMLYFQSPPHAFLLLLIEFFLGGAGHYFEMFGISIRTLFLICFLTLTVMHQVGIHFYREQKHIPNSLMIGIALVVIYTIIAAVRGVLSGHNLAALQDLFPYLYLLIIFPAYAMYRRFPFLRSATARLAVISIIGTSLYTLFNFVLFSTGIHMLHDQYYKWFRDVNVGKITDLGDNFFRIVESSHILIVPLILIITSLLMRREKHHWLWWGLHALLVLKLSINFSRGYILALTVGLFVLMLRHYKLRWLTLSTYTVSLFIVCFVVLHTVASGFTNPGFDELGLRSASIANPASETSSATRMMLLPAIIDQIETAPLFGQGLGSSVTYYNTETIQYEDTTQYDWGYLELLAELGIVGTLIYLGFLFGIGIAIIRKIWQLAEYHDFYVGVLGAFVALLVMHITAPILTHIFGIFAIIFAILIITKPVDLFDQFVIFLYRLFHREKEVE